MMRHVMKVADLYARAEQDLMDGRAEAALSGYLATVKAAPKFVRARLRVADALLNLNETERAKRVYKALAWHYIRSGQPLLGLVVCKMLLALDPGRYEDVLLILAELYSSESDRVADIELEPDETLPETLEGEMLGDVPLAGLLPMSESFASDTEAITAHPKQLPMIPLFSHLPEDAFIRVLGSLKLRRCADSERVVSEGETGDAFYMLADGEVAVSKKLGVQETVLARLHAGAVFGEMALVSKAPRTATVTARGEVALLSLSKSDLESHEGDAESVTKALKKFTRARFLANLTATSRFFSELSRSDRRELIGKFQSKSLHRGDVVIEEGEDGRGLYLVLRGELEVTRKHSAGNTLKLATLKSGDVFGEMSLLRNAPTVATVTAKTSGEVLFLPKDAFHEAMAAHPGVAGTLGSLSTERLRANTVFESGALSTDDASVLL
ncbi:MAG: cyclic nucleotide-binding domain-containing protein [Deltaproteobacteria bacterium]|nr:cyclic nucleotide-binding domain-containing protein [Deltaproteobacteria bacterium]